MNNVLEHINSIDELIGLCDFLEDDDFSTALDKAIKFIVQPVNPGQASQLIVKFQAYAVKFKMQATYYTYLEAGKAGTENNKKKNIYFAIADQCEKLSAALKYVGRD